MNDEIKETPQAPKTSETEELRHIEVKNASVKVLTKMSEAGLLKTSTETAKFQFTPKMVKWLDTAIEIKSISPVEVAHKCKIARETYYHWRSLPGFTQWFLGAWQEKRREWIPQLDIMGMKRAERNFDYWQGMKRTVGELLNNDEPQARQQVSILGGMTVQTINNIKQDTTSEQQE